MSEDVKTDRRAQRRADTERRLVAAAAELFVARGYAATTLTEVAAHSDVAPRTLYLHFATKAELLLRCIGVAIAGGPDGTPLAAQPEMTAAMTARTFDERVVAMATLTAALMERTGPLLDVAVQAAPSEPSVAAAAAAGRADTRKTLREFWTRLHRDGMLPRKADLEWLVETATLMAHAETYLLLRRTTDWDTDAYREWLTTTWRRLAAAS